MVVLIEDDGRGRPFQLSGDSACGGTYLAKPYLLLSLGAFVLQVADDDQVPVDLRERPFRWLLLVLFSVGLLVAAIFIGLGCPMKEVLHHVTILELVIHRIDMVGAWLLQELVEVVVSLGALILALGCRDLTGGGRSAILLVLLILTA